MKQTSWKQADVSDMNDYYMDQATNSKLESVYTMYNSFCIYRNWKNNQRMVISYY